jgi:hypothetical protein
MSGVPPDSSADKAFGRHNGSGINNPTVHQCCYKVKGAKLDPPENVEIEDQFGTLQLEVKKAKFLCQPCSKTVLP